MNRPENKIKFYQYEQELNVGDYISEPILNHFLGDRLIKAKSTASGKLLAVGSIMDKLRKGDIVWGTGILKEKETFDGEGCTFLAVRGKLTRDRIKNAKVPEVYGDPALLLPLIYNPKIEKKYTIGFVPHYVDQPTFKGSFIDVALPWKEFVDRILECRQIVSSSLHGIIIAEAYGIPATWEYSDKVLGQGFKFRDYFSGTGRDIKRAGRIPPIPNIVKIQRYLINALKNYYDHS